MKKENKSR